MYVTMSVYTVTYVTYTVTYVTFRKYTFTQISVFDHYTMRKNCKRKKVPPAVTDVSWNKID